MPSVIVVGAQWGDEGKGKIVDILASDARHVVRSQGGNNAGHTIKIGEAEYKLHLIPTGVLHPSTQCYIAAGTVIDPEVLIAEITFLEAKGHAIKGRLWISSASHVIFPYHRLIDQLLEKKKGPLSVGTTGRGIGPCYADKADRLGIRMGEIVRPDLFPAKLKEILQLKNEELSKVYGYPLLSYPEILQQYTSYAEQLKPYVVQTEEAIHRAIQNGENVVFEGAQGTFLDTTTGTYPYVSSSSTTAGGICVGAGIGPSMIDHTLGVLKAYTTRVGHGPFPTELKEGEKFLDHYLAREFGTTTGRKRRIGWFDGVLAKTAVCLNGLQSLALTKLDVLDSLESIKICIGYELKGKPCPYVPSLAEDLSQCTPIYQTMPGWRCPTKDILHYNDLPDNAKKYFEMIESICEIPISIISLGPAREQTITLKDPFTTKVKL